MKVSDKFNLGVTQGGLDFVDVDVENDVPLFIDPAAIRVQHGEWSEWCQFLLQSFFEELLAAIRANDVLRIRGLIRPLVEPNETHLGVSVGRSQGRGLGSGSMSEKLVQALANSRAAQTGLLQDLEDTALFIDGIGRDIISDITTNIIRVALISYTQQMCDFHGIALEEQTSGALWDPDNASWEERLVMLPRGEGDKLILVPKSLVRISSYTDVGKYYRGYIRPYLVAEEEGNPGSDLIRVLRDGTRKIRLGDLDERIGADKETLVEKTELYPDAFDRFKQSNTAETNPPLDHDQLRIQTVSPSVDLQDLLDAVLAVRPGGAGATSYHRAVAALLTALFDAMLGNEKIETRLYGGLKRIDITYDNIAGFGFFRWLSLNYPAAIIVIECKNYSDDLGNEELDQLLGRFGTNRGKIGIIVCRRFMNKERFLARCKAAAMDGQGFPLVLDDDDLQLLVDELDELLVSPSNERGRLEVLRRQFDALIGLI